MDKFEPIEELPPEMNELFSAAVTLQTLFQELTSAGFTEDQALKLLTYMYFTSENQ